MDSLACGSQWRHQRAWGLCRHACGDGSRYQGQEYDFWNPLSACAEAQSLSLNDWSLKKHAWSTSFLLSPPSYLYCLINCAPKQLYFSLSLFFLFPFFSVSSYISELRKHSSCSSSSFIMFLYSRHLMTLFLRSISHLFWFRKCQSFKFCVGLCCIFARLQFWIHLFFFSFLPFFCLPFLLFILFVVLKTKKRMMSLAELDGAQKKVSNLDNQLKSMISSLTLESESATPARNLVDSEEGYYNFK